MAPRPPLRGTTNPDVRPRGSTHADGGAPRSETPSRIDADTAMGGGRVHPAEIRRVPESTEAHATGTSSITVSEIVFSASSGSAEVTASRLLQGYRVPATARLPEAGVNGLRIFKGRSYADVSDVGIVQVGKDSNTGQYRAKMPDERTASGPALEYHPDSRLWHPQPDVETTNSALTDARYPYQRAIEGEQPYTWDERTLIKRLGAQAQGLDEAYADVLAVSRVESDAVRRMYANNEPIIPLLQDTVTRFGIDREVGRFIDCIGSKHAPEYLHADFQFQFELLDGVWPGKAIVLVDADGTLLKGLGPASSTPVPLSRDRLVDGDLLKTLLSHLNEAETKTLLNIAPGEPLSTPEANARQLRRQLAQWAEQRKTYLFDQRYRDADRATTPEAAFVQDKLGGCRLLSHVSWWTSLRRRNGKKSGLEFSPADLKTLGAGRFRTCVSVVLTKGFI